MHLNAEDVDFQFANTLTNLSMKRNNEQPRHVAKKKKKKGRKRQQRGPQKMRGAFQPMPPRPLNPKTVETVISKLPAMSFDQIRTIWSNAIRYVADDENSEMKDAAKEMLLAIGCEWSQRAEMGIGADDYFDWPSTDAPGGTGRLKLYNIQQDGMLSYLGYRVGQTHGVPSNIRRAILNQIFSGHLPPVFPEPYLNEWHAPGSSLRLKKLAETIAALTRNAKHRKDVDMTDAVRAWEQDLRFLYDKYYVGHFRFVWPLTSVN